MKGLHSLLAEGPWASRNMSRAIRPLIVAEFAPGTRSSASCDADGCPAPPRWRSTEQAIVQERQRLLQVRVLELVQDLPQSRAATHPLPQPGQLRQRRLRPAAAVEQAVHLVHDPPQGSHRGTPGHRRNVRCSAGVRWRSRTDDDARTDPRSSDRGAGAAGPSVSPPACRGARGAASASAPPAACGLSHGPQDRLVQFLQDVELADLMRHVGEDLRERLRVQGRAIGGDAATGQPAAGQGRPEPAEETRMSP